MEVKAIKLNSLDNVATVVNDIQKGQECFIMGEDAQIKIMAIDDIPFGHKIALQDFEMEDKIIKYNEIIGTAGKEINTGQHVHTHNLQGIRGRGDKKLNK